MKPNRRQFARMLALGAAVPLAPQRRGGQEDQPSVPAAQVDAKMKLIESIPMNADRTGQIRQSVEQTIRQIDKIRDYKLSARALEPALNMAMTVNAAARGGRRAG